MKGKSPKDVPTLEARIVDYYRFHSSIYDLTRWSFLFGRRSLLSLLPSLFKQAPSLITEFGCGTGSNLLCLSRMFSGSSITGLDLSPDMLQRAKSRCANNDDLADITLVLSNNFEPLSKPQDLILFSYCLSMINPGSLEIILNAISRLTPTGLIAVVDFNQTPLPFYRSFMAANHVSLSGELYSTLLELLVPVHHRVHHSYFGAWSYFVFVGRPRQSQSA